MAEYGKEKAKSPPGKSFQKKPRSKIKGDEDVGREVETKMDGGRRGRGEEGGREGDVRSVVGRRCEDTERRGVGMDMIDP